MTAKQLLDTEAHSEFSADHIMQTAAIRMKRIAYAKGYDDCLSRLKMLACVVPESVTKVRLVHMIQSEAAGAEAAFSSALNQFETT